MFAARRLERVRQDARRVGRDADEAHAAQRRRGLEPRIGQRFAQHDIARRRFASLRKSNSAFCVPGQITRRSPRACGTRRASQAAASSRSSGSAARLAIVEIGGEGAFALDRRDAAGEPSVEIRFERLRRQVHREIELRRRDIGGARCGACLRHEGALADPRFGQPALARLGVGARDRRQVDAERLGKRPMGR